MGRHYGQRGRLEDSEGFRANDQHGRLKWSEHNPSLSIGGIEEGPA